MSVVSLLASAGGVPAHAIVRLVPADHATIQAAIDAAAAGDSVLVSPGFYPEHLDFRGKPIVVESSDGPGVTTIDGGGAGPVVVFATNEGRASVLRGFTIQNGFNRFGDPGFAEGGGITIQDASPIVEGNAIVNNRACTGCGIGVGFGSPLIRENLIQGNRQGGCSSGIGGAGISLRGAATAEILDNVIVDNVSASAALGGGISLFAAGFPTIRRNIISRNTVTGSTNSQGGGISMVNLSEALITDNVISGNMASGGGGGIYVGSEPRILNNTIADNDSPEGAGIQLGFSSERIQVVNNIVTAAAGRAAIAGDFFQGPDVTEMRSNDVYVPGGPAYGGDVVDRTGVDGNISVDPLFVDGPSADYRLQPTSPCVDAGDGTVSGLDTIDLAGASRVADGDGDSIAAIDMGAYEAPAAPLMFDAFACRLVMRLRTPGSDSLNATGTFTLAAGSDGLDANAEPVRVTVADTDGAIFDQELAPGTVRRVGFGRFTYRAARGSVGIVRLKLIPIRLGPSYKLSVRAKGLDLGNPSVPPASLVLHVGDDVGSAVVALRVR